MSAPLAEEPLHLHFHASGRGEPIIVLHGLLGSLDNWHTISRKLADHFRVFAVDQRNHGQSPHTPEMDYSLMAGDVLELMDHNGLRHAHLLGHSMGGKTAMQFALLHPDRVNKLIVVDITPRRYKPVHLPIFEALLSLDLSASGSRKEIEDALAASIPELAMRRFLLKNLGTDPQSGFSWKIGLREIQKDYPRLCDPVGGGRPFAGPTLFIRGGRSPYVTEEDWPVIRALFPQAQLRTIPGAGHWVHADRPEPFWQALLQFLAPPAVISR